MQRTRKGFFFSLLKENVTDQSQIDEIKISMDPSNRDQKLISMDLSHRDQGLISMDSSHWDQELISKDPSLISSFSEIKNPLDQFEIRDLISLKIPLLDNLHLSITNIGAYLLVSIVLIINLSLLSTNNEKIIENKSSMWQQSLYDTIHSIVINQINANKGEIFFPFIYSLFIFILVNNLISMIPYSFASTSHFILTFSISFTIVLGATILGFNKHGLEFFSLFVPAGCPLALLPVLVLIEFVSYLTRNVSLGLRLAANITSGHLLLSILSGFTYNIMTSGLFFFFLSLVPLAFIIAFSGLELGLAFIQAQVFVVLTCSYIKDTLELH